MTAYYRRNDCRFCSSARLVPYLDLGDQPPSNSFIRPEELGAELRYPLSVSLCLDCGLSQLRDVVPAASIFTEYQYRSSTSKALVEHYAAMAKALAERLKIGEGDAVLDIGCNDGILLNGYPPAVKRRIGVEPSNLAELARQCGHVVYQRFFDEEAGRAIQREQGHMRLITATNVFAHIDDIHPVVEGVKALLDDGVFVIEAPYVLDMVESNYFDTVYHEHLCYLSVTPLSRLMERHGMEVFDVERVSLGASGPAIRVFCRRQTPGAAPSENVERFLREEHAWKLLDPEPYRAFAARLDAIRRELMALLNDLKTRGARIGCYGAPAKGNTLLNTFGLTSALITEGVAETNAIKCGKLTPGTHLPIVSEEEFLARMPDYAVLLAWNYLDFMLKSSEYIKRGGRFIVPLPKPTIRPVAC